MLHPRTTATGVRRSVFLLIKKPVLACNGNNRITVKRVATQTHLRRCFSTEEKSTKEPETNSQEESELTVAQETLEKQSAEVSILSIIPAHLFSPLFNSFLQHQQRLIIAKEAENGMPEFEQLLLRYFAVPFPTSQKTVVEESAKSFFSTLHKKVQKLDSSMEEFKSVTDEEKSLVDKEQLVKSIVIHSIPVYLSLVDLFLKLDKAEMAEGIVHMVHRLFYPKRVSQENQLVAVKQQQQQKNKEDEEDSDDEDEKPVVRRQKLVDANQMLDLPTYANIVAKYMERSEYKKMVKFIRQIEKYIEPHYFYYVPAFSLLKDIGGYYKSLDALPKKTRKLYTALYESIVADKHLSLSLHKHLSKLPLNTVLNELRHSKDGPSDEEIYIDEDDDDDEDQQDDDDNDESDDEDDNEEDDDDDDEEDDDDDDDDDDDEDDVEKSNSSRVPLDFSLMKSPQNSKLIEEFIKTFVNPKKKDKTTERRKRTKSKQEADEDNAGEDDEGSSLALSPEERDLLKNEWDF